MPTPFKIFTDAKAALLIHRLIVFRFLLFSFGSLAAATQTALAGMDWAAANHQTRLMVTIGILASWSIAMSAFLDRSMAKIQSGENPFVDQANGTSTEEKTVTAQVVTTRTTHPEPVAPTKDQP
jgi:hypothetical protein